MWALQHQCLMQLLAAERGIRHKPVFRFLSCAMRIAIIGGGVIGVSSAWYLARAGHEVTVVERQPQLALETSYANGGQISVSHSDPWASPANLLQALRWMGREDAPLLFRPRFDWAQWRWALRFLHECWPSRVDKNTRELVALGLHSRAQLGLLRNELQLEYEANRCGILHVYSQAGEYRRGLAHAARLRAFGCRRDPLTREQCLQLEPSLEFQRDRLLGGTFTVDDEIGDARLYTLALADKAAELGAAFLLDTQLTGFEREPSGGIRALQLMHKGSARLLQADAYVLAAGSYSALMAHKLGFYIPVYPAKGYSVTLPIPDGARVPAISLIDDEHRIVFSRLGQRLRVAGTAEFNGYNTDLNSVRGQVLVDYTRQWFPDMQAVEQAEHWTGLRPATPGNVPLIQRSPIENLYLNTGHGTLGWTLAAGSGQLLAKMLERNGSDWREVMPLLQP